MYTVLLLLVFSSLSQGYVWESLRPQRNYTTRFQYVPPLNETAVKLAKHFLAQGEAKYWEPEIKSPQFRFKRQLERRRTFLPYDVLFIIDSSGSIRKRDFVLGIDALVRLISKARPDTIYASITYSTYAEIDFLFESADLAKSNLSQIEYRAGMTNTQAALDIARRVLFNFTAKPGLRIESYKRVLIVTDGQSNVEKPKTLYNAFRLKNLGIELFVVAVGKYMKGIAEIVGLASSTDAHLFRVKDLADFSEVVQMIPDWRELRMAQHKTWLHQMSLQEHEYYGN